MCQEMQRSPWVIYLSELNETSSLANKKKKDLPRLSAHSKPAGDAEAPSEIYYYYRRAKNPTNRIKKLNMNIRYLKSADIKLNFFGRSAYMWVNRDLYSKAWCPLTWNSDKEGQEAGGIEVLLLAKAAFRALNPWLYIRCPWWEGKLNCRRP